MNQRKPIGNKLRFEVFKRDSFSCQYCGMKPPNTTLEVDHIVPVFSGGKNNIDNLITSCFNCNRGKSKNELTSIPDSLDSKIAVMKEKEKQYKEFKKYQDIQEKRLNDSMSKVSDIFSLYWTRHSLTEKFLNGSVRKFLTLLNEYDVYDAMHTACSKMNSVNNSTKYFCGICWSKIKGGN